MTNIEMAELQSDNLFEELKDEQLETVVGGTNLDPSKTTGSVFGTGNGLYYPVVKQGKAISDQTFGFLN